MPRCIRVFVVLSVLALVGLTGQILADSVTLAWDHSPDASVVGYRIYWGNASATYTNYQVTGYVSETTVSNLLKGSTYYFAATAFTGDGLESDFSNEVSYTVPTTPPVSGLSPPGLWVAQ